jgi:hypothetical protein
MVDITSQQRIHETVVSIDFLLYKPVDVSKVLKCLHILSYPKMGVTSLNHAKQPSLP